MKLLSFNTEFHLRFDMLPLETSPCITTPIPTVCSRGIAAAAWSCHLYFLILKEEFYSSNDRQVLYTRLP